MPERRREDCCGEEAEDDKGDDSSSSDGRSKVGKDRVGRVMEAGEDKGADRRELARRVEDGTEVALEELDEAGAGKGLQVASQRRSVGPRLLVG